MIGQTILHYKILSKIGEGGSPREIRYVNRSVISKHRGLEWLWIIAIVVISRGKWALRMIREEKF